MTPEPHAYAPGAAVDPSPGSPGRSEGPLGWRDVAIGVIAVTIEWATHDEHQMWRWGGHVPLWVSSAWMLLGVVILLGRRHHPVAVMAAAWVYGLGRLAMHGIVPFAVPLVALQALAARRPRRCALPVAVSLLLPFGVTILDGHEMAEHDYGSVASSVVTLVMLVVAALVAGRREADQMTREELAAQQLQAVAAEALAAERRRLARELHDNLGHAITAMTLQAAGARTVASNGPAPDARVTGALEAIGSTGAEALRELHRLLGVLRTQGDVATTTRSSPGLADLCRLVAGARAGGLEVRTSTAGTVRELDPSVDFAAYRLVQEALSNAMRHEHRGADCQVCITYEPATLSVEVRTVMTRRRERIDGGGFGLSGLRERILLVGGQFQAGREGTEFVTRATLPAGSRTGAGNRASTRVGAPAAGA